MKNESENSEEEILEGEIVGKIPEKKSPDRFEQSRPDFDLFALPVFAKLKQNCLLAAASFILLTIAAIYLKNGWLFLLALLLPPWIFSRK